MGSIALISGPSLEETWIVTQRTCHWTLTRQRWRAAGLNKNESQWVATKDTEGERGAAEEDSGQTRRLR